MKTSDSTERARHDEAVTLQAIEDPAGDGGMVVIDCSGMVVMPASVNFAEPGNAGSLAPGEPADIAVVRIYDPEGTPTAPVAHRGGHLELVVTAGRVTFYRGRDAEDAPGRDDLADDELGEHPYVGLWVDENDFLRQELLPDGRYDEARGDRTSAYQGRYWIDGTRIEYLDDLGSGPTASFTTASWTTPDTVLPAAEGNRCHRGRCCGGNTATSTRLRPTQGAIS